MNGGGIHYPLCPWNARFQNEQDPAVARVHPTTPVLYVCVILIIKWMLVYVGCFTYLNQLRHVE